MCDLESHRLHPCYSCPRRDSGAQRYRHQGKNNEVDYLLTHLTPWITVPFRYAAKTPSIRGPFKEDVMPNELLTCGVEKCKHGGGWLYGYKSEARGGEDE